MSFRFLREECALLVERRHGKHARNPAVASSVDPVLEELRAE